MPMNDKINGNKRVSESVVSGMGFLHIHIRGLSSLVSRVEDRQC
jgi:hypothetical protein